MKKMISGLFVLLLMSMSVLASAETTQTKKVLPNGDVVLITPTPTGQKVSPEAMSYLWSAGRVLSGEEFVPIGVTRVKMDGWIHYHTVTTYDTVVTLDDSGQNVVVKKVATVVKKGEVQFAWFIVFIMLSFVVMVVFHQEVRKDNINNSVAVNKGIVLFILNFSFLLLYVLQPHFPIVGFILILMTVLSLGLVLSIIGENRKVFNILSVLFYLSMASLLFVIYTS